MLEYFYVSLGGALGTAGRYWLSTFIALRAGSTFPLGTLVINVSGSFIIGLFFALTQPDGRFPLVNPTFRQFFLIGICGGYTTFSSFSLQTLTLAQGGEWLRAGLNIIGSVVLCLLGVWLGQLLAVSLNKI